MYLLTAVHFTHKSASQSVSQVLNITITMYIYIYIYIYRSFYNCGTFWGRLKMTISCKFNKLLFEKYSDWHSYSQGKIAGTGCWSLFLDKKNMFLYHLWQNTVHSVTYKSWNVAGTSERVSRIWATQHICLNVIIMIHMLAFTVFVFQEAENFFFVNRWHEKEIS